MGLSERVRSLSFRRTPEEDLLPFRPGMPALDAFPLAVWLRAMDRAGRTQGGRPVAYASGAGRTQRRHRPRHRDRLPDGRDDSGDG